MKPKVRNIIIIALLAVVVVVFNIIRRNSTMRGLETTIEIGGKYALLTPNDIDSMIYAAIPNLTTKDIADINEKQIASIVNKNPYVLTSDVSVTTGGKVRVEVTQRQPVVRVFYQGNEFYLSRQGTFMPISAEHYCHILVGNSEKQEPRLKDPSKIKLADTSIHRQPEGLLKIWKLAVFLYDNPQYGDVFDQIYLSPEGDLCVVPKLSSLTIEVGDTSRLETKFRNLWIFFDQGINQVGWDAYRAISLKYEGQVVCTRKE